MRNTRSRCGIMMVARPSVRGHRCDARRCAVRVGRILLGHVAAVVDTKRSPTRGSLLQRLQMGGVAHLHPPFPVGDGNGHHRSPPCRRRRRTGSLAPAPG